MTIALLVFLGGILTILSPCVLPVLPFIFARAQQPFIRSGLPMLLGMAITFAAIATLAAVGGAWAVHVNQYGRYIALVLMAVFALSLLARRLADRLAAPLVALGNRLLPSATAAADPGSWPGSMLLGVATGLLWAPCAGPILGLVLTSAAISGPNLHTSLLLFTYAAGATTSLAIAILAGKQLFQKLKALLGTGEWLRRGLGVAVLLGVVTIAAGWDTSYLTRISANTTAQLEQGLLGLLQPVPQTQGSMAMSGNNAMMAGDAMMAGNDAMMSSNAMSASNSMMMASNDRTTLPVEGSLPGFEAAGPWLNSTPLTANALRGKVVLVDFWTYSCINCLRTLPYVNAWDEKYRRYGLVVIGVHAPEFAFEKDLTNVKRAVADLGIRYPVVLDNDYAVWQRFNNQYWPAHYFIDAKGQIRGHHFGEGHYLESEQTIRKLLQEAGATDLPPLTGAAGQAESGLQLPADEAHNRSPETYLGYERSSNFSSPQGIKQDQPQRYSSPANLEMNHWGLEGQWQIGADRVVLGAAPGKLSFRFSARDLHLVLAPPASSTARFRIKIDGKAPGDDHGMDVDADGFGTLDRERLYQLVRQRGPVTEHTFTIEFLTEGVAAYVFTFG